MIHDLVYLVAAILIAGVLVWALDQLPGIDATFKQVARILIIVVLVIYAIVFLMGLFGVAAPWGGKESAMNETLNAAVKTWQTTLAGLIAGGLTYANQIGASYPKNGQEWAAAGMAAAMLWLGTKAQQTK